MCLIAATGPASLAHWLWVIVQVIFAIGFVIFVHELGHFLVARACGVKCPKFRVGFDVPFGLMINKLLGREGEFTFFGWRIPSTIGPPVTIGETEYAIGIVPFGGYVRMLGQDDDPANYAEQLRESMVEGNQADAKEVLGPDGKTYLVDKRSYLAKSVPQRMAIISAGVVMNVIFAFIFAVIAYKIGVPYNPTVVSQTEPGSPAWRADLRPGDEVVRIADGVEGPSFDELRGSVSLGDIEAGIPFVIRRGDERIEKRLFPKQGRGMPRVGMAPPFSLIVGKAFADTAAAEASPPFEPGDAIEAVDGVPVTTFAQFSSILAQRPGDELRVTVRRGGEPAPNARGGPLTGGEMVDITLPARPRRTLGLVMQMGRIANVQDNSPAAGQLAAGDFIDRIADAAGSPGGDRRAEPLAFDPMTLPDDLRQMADNQREVEIVVRRRSSGDEGRQTTETIVIPLRRVQWLEAPLGGENEPVVATALGAAYHVLSVVARVEPDSPAAKAGLQVNDVVTHAEFLLPEDAKDMPPLKPLEFSSDEDDRKANWPSLMALVNELPPGSQVKLVFRRGNETLTATVAPEDDPRYFNPERGLAFHVLERMRIADTWSEAGRLGWDETVGALSMVYRFLGKLGTQVSVTSLGGPITIAKAAGFSAFEGPGKLLIFLTMLSANLAVLNFLPIPLLDGGHMVFLIWEGIRGKPANEKFMMATQTAGFVFIITLMLFVLSLDLELIPRKL